MLSLLEIPVVVYIAEYVWGQDAESCLSSLPFLSMPCVTQAIAKWLGISIILGACLNKIPIMRNIIQSQSSAGLSRTALYGEAIVYMNCAFYGLFEGFPITAYGENVALLFQNTVLILMSWQFADKNSKVSSRERMLVILGACTHIFFVTQMLPKDQYQMLMASGWPIMAYSRGSQVFETFKVKHTGAQSIVTTTMNLSGSLARVFTTVKEVGWDMAVLIGFFLSAFLNLIMFVQYIVYQQNTAKFIEKLEKEKKE